MKCRESQVVGYQDLLRYFEEGGKREGALRIGGEFELFGVEPRSGKAMPFDGPRGVGRVMERMLADPKWSPMCEEERLICLAGDDASSITIEPGAQIELSGAPHSGLREVLEELERFRAGLRSASRGLEIEFIGMGMHPVSRPEEIPLVQKCRYRIMAPYLQNRGRLAHAMMKETAAVQVNLDYRDETDAMDKFRTGMGISSLVSAIFANSPFSDGRPNGFLTRRQHVWHDTDPDRCGLLGFVFAGDAGFEDYLRYALRVPMMFVIRNGRWLAMEGLRFGDFLRNGHAGLRATRGDWDLHLSTLFPEVRLKTYLEFRGADAQAPGLAGAVPALWTGLLYDDEARAAAWDLVRPWTWTERRALHREIPRQGLAARVRGRPILGPARELVRVAREGLVRLGEDTRLLEPLEELILLRGKTPAEVLLERWEALHHRLPPLIRETSYLHQA